MKTENSDRDLFYLHPPAPENALKCFVTSCVLSKTFSLINLLTKTEKDTKASLNLHIDTGYTESAITNVVECRSLVSLLVPTSPSRRVALFKFLLSVNKIIKCTCNELDKANKY